MIILLYIVVTLLAIFGALMIALILSEVAQKKGFRRVNKEAKLIIDDFLARPNSWTKDSYVRDEFKKNCIIFNRGNGGIVVYPDDTYDEFSGVHLDTGKPELHYYKAQKEKMESAKKKTFVSDKLKAFKPTKEIDSCVSHMAELSISKKEAKNISGLGTF